jgi:hypothetical protein
MSIENIVEICVAIDIAILGIAYPIIIDKISNIGDKYSSEYIPVLFNNVFPQRGLRLKFRKGFCEISYLKLTLYITIVSFLPLIFKSLPLFGWDNWFISNSAHLIVFSFSTLLTIFFFIWLDKVLLYNGRATTLLVNVIANYNRQKNDTEMKSYHLKAINEMTYYAIEKQDEHLQEHLLRFYHHVFSEIRRSHDKSKPLDYPVDLYFLVYRLNSQLIDSQNKKLLKIEHRAVSGIWLLGEFDEVPISGETYRWLWININVICDTERFIRMYWARASQHFDYRLPRIHPEFDAQRNISNSLEIEQREQDRKKFLEMHFALGGLLLYRKQYESLKYIFEYTQSEPPKYVLLPDTMTDIFYWFEYFHNDFSHDMPIDSRYNFRELDNLGSSKQVSFWICSYLVLLFIRQYSLYQYYTFQSFTSRPDLPKTATELNNWLDAVLRFRKCLSRLLKNEELFRAAMMAL